jgi:uncharacterized membrane protein
MQNAKLQGPHTLSQHNLIHGSGSRVVAAALAGATMITLGVYYQRVRRERMSRPADSAPPRTAKAIMRRHEDRAVTGKTVTINRPRAEVYRCWRDFSNLPSFMENVLAVEPLEGGRFRWAIAGPAGTTVDLVTELVEERENELLSWQSVENSEIDAHGSVKFRDARGGRGTEVEAVIAYKPPGGEIGRWVAKLFQREPAIQGRRELKRLKMLLETGEIATSKNHRDGADRKTTNASDRRAMQFENQRFGEV